ncbi:hypothetical protein D082_40130 (plasmid) [Synechocystis sp. PCC 6714]|nr:hypothetical protein D082_40130 [Synechocystis sp. PCC 6714]
MKKLIGDRQILLRVYGDGVATEKQKAYAKQKSAIRKLINKQF